MEPRPAIRLYLYLVLAALAFAAQPAFAQFTPRSLEDPATGEVYHIEGSVGFWNPGAQMDLASAGRGPLSGIPGTLIDFKNDLGLTDNKFPELRLTLRPARKHKFRMQYIPINYAQEGVTVPTRFVFNGQSYNVGVPVDWKLKWKAYRFGYEYDAVYTNRFFIGFVMDFKYTDVEATLITSNTTEFTHARAPIPAPGGIFRVYIVPNISVTGEITGFKLPEKAIKDAQGHYIDVDFYTTVNITDNVGGQIGYRSFDLGYQFSRDAGNFDLKGMYFGVVARY